MHASFIIYLTSKHLYFPCIVYLLYALIVPVRSADLAYAM
jgi:hypothetical protein